MQGQAQLRTALKNHQADDHEGRLQAAEGGDGYSSNNRIVHAQPSRNN